MYRHNRGTVTSMMGPICEDQNFRLRIGPVLYRPNCRTVTSMMAPIRRSEFDYELDQFCTVLIVVLLLV